MRKFARLTGMYVQPDTYATRVAFIEGFNQATEGELLQGFGDWIVDRSPSVSARNFVWSAVVAARTWGNILDGRTPIEAIPVDLQEVVKADLMDLLLEFLDERAANANDD